MLVLVTRPRLDAEKTAAKLAALGHEALIDPVIEIEALPFVLPQREFQAVVFTSANAVRALDRIHLEKLYALPVFAVGDSTAEAARERGFTKVESADGDVNALAALLARKLAKASDVLHLAGEDRAGDLPGMLSAQNIRADVLPIYKARMTSALRKETVAAFNRNKIGTVLHYSERSALAFVKLSESVLREATLHARHIAISEAAARPLRDIGARVSVANVPNEAAMFGLLT